MLIYEGNQCTRKPLARGFDPLATRFALREPGRPRASRARPYALIRAVNLIFGAKEAGIVQCLLGSLFLFFSVIENTYTSVASIQCFTWYISIVI